MSNRIHHGQRPYALGVSLLTLLLSFTCVIPSALAVPGFARKYGLRCSACHEAWPKLNPYGQAFKDNGYQIGNERDSPVYMSPFYWPISLRITPQWHNERNSAQATDQAVSINPLWRTELHAYEATQGVQSVSTQGFDLSGMDLLAEGLLSKNITFLLLPSSDEYGNFHFESAWVRFDNLMKSPWLNVKAGKFELDTVISEKRILTLSQNGGFYQIYHYLPGIDPAAYALTEFSEDTLGASTTSFGLGDNQLGIELMGHSKDDYTRYSASLLSSSDGSVNLPTSSGYDGFFHGSHAWNAGKFGVHRAGGFSYVGQSPTRYLTQTPLGGTPVQIAGSGYGNKGFTRTGGYGLLTYKTLSLAPMYTHASESAYIALGIPANETLPHGVANPTWNGRMLELNYTPTLQLSFTARYEDIRNASQLFTHSLHNFGDLDAETVAVRWYPFMTSRDGLAVHAEYSKVHATAISAIGTDQTLRSAFAGLDFAF